MTTIHCSFYIRGNKIGYVPPCRCIGAATKGTYDNTILYNINNNNFSQTLPKTMQGGCVGVDLLLQCRIGRQNVSQKVHLKRIK